MRILGLSGGSGSGKSTVAGFFADLGIPVFDCDAVYHRMIVADSPVTREIAAAFGEDVLSGDGGIDRKKLAGIVFAGDDRAKLDRLNEITHRHVRNAFDAWRDGQDHPVGLLDAPLLYEAAMDSACDAVIAVIADPDVRARRISSRDGISEDAARVRIAAQITNEDLVARADYVIDNSGDPDDLKKQTKQLINKLKERGIIR